MWVLFVSFQSRSWKFVRVVALELVMRSMLGTLVETFTTCGQVLQLAQLCTFSLTNHIYNRGGSTINALVGPRTLARGSGCMQSQGKIQIPDTPLLVLLKLSVSI
jgi:hypothetical protein